MKDLNIIVGQKIQSRLDDLGMTQVDLAEELETSRQVVNKIIHGRKNITLEEIKNIASILDFSVKKLLDEDDNSNINAEDPIIAFMGEVDSKDSKDGLSKAKKAMDLIIFHRDLQEEHHKVISG